MSDARLDLEVVINGTHYAAKGLDDVAGASKRVGTSSSETSSQTKLLTSAIDGLSQGAQAANAAQSALANLTAGNFVGAFNGATVSVKGLWKAMFSSPVTALIAGFTALTAAGLALITMHERAADAAREQAEEERKLRDEVARIKHTDSVSVHQEIANAAVKKGDMEALEKMREKLMAIVAEQENLVLMWGFSTDRLKEAQGHLDVYNDAIETLQERIESAADADRAASAEALKNAQDKIAAERELAWQKERSAEADLDLTTKELARRKELRDADSEMNRLMVERKHLLEDLEQYREGEGAETEKARLLTLDKIDEVEQKIGKLKKEQDKTSETEGARRLKDEEELLKLERDITREKLRGALGAAEDEILNPGSAEKKRRDEEAEDRKRQRKLEAGLSGNSVEANKRRKDYEEALAAYMAWLAGGGDPAAAGAPANPATDPKMGGNGGQAPGGVPAPTDPWSQKLDAIKSAIEDLRGDLTGGAT